MLITIFLRSIFAFLCCWSLLPILSFDNESISFASTEKKGRNKEYWQQKNPTNHTAACFVAQLGTNPRCGGQKSSNIWVYLSFHTLPVIVSNRHEDQPSIIMPSRINLHMCVNILVVELWTPEVIAIGIKFYRVIVLAHIWISSFTDCSFPIPGGRRKSIQSCRRALLEGSQLTTRNTDHH